MPSTASLQTVQTLYIAYYGRPADPQGLQFWAEQLDQADGDLTAILEDFGNSAEFTDAFGELDNAARVNNLYQQLFGRDAEPEGRDAYVAALESGEVSLAEIAAEIAGGAQNADAEALAAKRDAADRFTESLAETLGGEQAYGGDGAVAAARDYLAQVTTSEEAAAAAPQGVVDQLVTSASDAYTDAIQTLYIAYYGRPGDPEGVAFWAAQALVNDGDLESLVAAFGNSEEYTEGLAQLEPEAQVEALYLQIFGREADEEGLAFYSQALADGTLTLADIALAIVNGAAEDDREVLDARVEVAKAVTASLDTQEELDRFASEEGLAAMRDLLSGVTSREQADAVLDDVDQAVSNALDTPLPQPAVTLAEALNEAPASPYRLDASTPVDAGVLSVAEAEALYAQAAALVEGAVNARVR